MPMRALVADDDDLMRAFICLGLGAVQVGETVEASDGEEAWSRFNEQPFDLILLDWHMPRKSGLEVLRAIRASGSSVPVIMITAEAERSQVIEAIDAGASDYLIKPFEPAMLWLKVQKVVGVG